MMIRLVPMLSAIAAMSGCQYFAEEDLESFSPTSMAIFWGDGLRDNKPEGVSVTLDRLSRSDCAALSGDVRGTINGVRLELEDAGNPKPYIKGSGWSCPSARFSAPGSSLAEESEGVTHVVIEQNGYRVAASFRNGASARQLRPVGSTTLSPGTALELQWSPSTDEVSVDDTVAMLENQDTGIEYLAPLSLQDGLILAALADEVASGSYTVDLLVSAFPELVACEGVTSCDVLLLDHFSLSITVM